MRKLVIALAAIAAFGLAVPVVSTPADAQSATVVVKKKSGKHMHRGHRHVTVIKSDRRAHSHSHGRTTKVIIKKKRPAARVTVRTN